MRKVEFLDLLGDRAGGGNGAAQPQPTDSAQDSSRGRDGAITEDCAGLPQKLPQAEPARLSPAEYRKRLVAAQITVGAVLAIPSQALLATGPEPRDREFLELVDYFRRKVGQLQDRWTIVEALEAEARRS